MCAVLSPAPVEIGGRVTGILQVGCRKPPTYCRACLPPVEWPTVVELIWSGEADDVTKCEECGILLFDLQPDGSEPSGDWWVEIEGSIRDLAVERVDAREGYTCEFAVDPDDHRAMYAEEERKIWSQVAALAARRAD